MHLPRFLRVQLLYSHRSDDMDVQTSRHALIFTLFFVSFSVG